MKRSEMLEKIGEYFHNKQYTYWSKLSEEYGLKEIPNLEEIGEFLDFLEDCGMEPPKSTYWNVDKNGVRQVSMFNGDYTNHWETDQEVEWKIKNEKK